MTTPVPWSMKKPGPMRGAGMDVDAGPAVGPFGHHPRDERHVELVQHVGEAVDGDRFQAGIAEDDFVERLARRVAVVGGLDVGRESSRGVRELLEEQQRLGLAEGFVVLDRFAIVRAIGVRRAGFVAECAADLSGEAVVQAVNELADVEADVAAVQALASCGSRGR